MKLFGLLLVSFVISTQALAAGYCNVTDTVYLNQLPFEIRNQVQTTKKYPVNTWLECYRRGFDAASTQDFEKTLTLCQEGNCQDLTGPVFVSWYFWSSESLVTVEGQVTTYTWKFDRSVQRGDRRFFPDGSMFP